MGGEDVDYDTENGREGGGEYRTESGKEGWVEVIKRPFERNGKLLYREKGYSGES